MLPACMRALPVLRAVACFILRKRGVKVKFRDTTACTKAEKERTPDKTK